MTRFSPQSIALIQLALDSFVKSAIILLAAGALAVTLRRASAASRHLVWSLAIVSLLALPIFSFALPSWRLPVLPSLAAASVDAGSRESVGGIVVATEFERQRDIEALASRHRQPFDLGSELSASSSASPESAINSEKSFDWKAALPLVWLLGAFAAIARLVAGTARVWLLTRRAERVTESSWMALARALATRLRLRRRVEIFKTEQVSLPMTWGLLRPVVLLPREAERWPEECRRIVLMHELTHVKRRDCLMQTLAQVVCALYWFNPLVWIAAWRLRVEREVACDDHVLESGTKASDYAGHLVEIASLFRTSNSNSPVAVGMACSHLESRVRSILDPNARRRGASGLKVALAAVCAAVLTAPLAMLQPWRNAEASERKDRASVNSINPPNLPFPANLLIRSFKEPEERQKQVGEGQGAGQVSGQAQGQGKSGELTVDQLIEMKTAGVTPEYIESIRKLGYSELTAKQATELRGLGVDEEFVKQARGWTNGNLSIEDLVELKAIGMSPEFINGMKQAGYGELPIKQLVEMRAVGVNPEFVESMRRAGFDKLTADELTELKAMGVNEAFVKEAQGWGFGKLSLDDLVEIKAIGINPEYARSMKALGFDNLSLDKLVEMKSVGVNEDFIRQTRELGFDKLSLDQLIEMKAVGVTPDYIRKMRAAGLKNVSINELIEMKATGMDKILTKEKR